MKRNTIILLVSIAIIGLFLGEINDVVGEIVKPLSDKPITGNVIAAASCTVGGGYYKDCYKSWGRTRSKKKARAECTLNVYDDQTYAVYCNDNRISFRSIICQGFSKKGLIKDITTKILCEDYVRATKDGERDDDVGKRIKVLKTSNNKLQLWLSDINCWDCDNGRCTNYGRNRRSFKTFTCEVDIPAAPIQQCTDSDGGKDYYTKGYIINEEGIRSDDECNPGPSTTEDDLLEYYCTGDLKEPALGVLHKCTNGCENGVCRKPCKTDFKVATIYVYENDSNLDLSINRLNKLNEVYREVGNIAGRGFVTFDFETDITLMEIIPNNREDLFSYDANGLWIDYIKVINRFYETHDDKYDFLNVYTNFPENRFYQSNAMYHIMVQNKIEGIGLGHAFDISDVYTTKKLLGLNYLGDISFIFNNEALTEFNENQINCMNAMLFIHETTHQWAAYIGDKYGSGGSLILRFGFDGTHWSTGLNIGYDPVGGGKWKDNNDGTFTLLEHDEFCAERDLDILNRYGIDKFSDLTLYLIGAISADQVKPILWVDYNGPLQPGTTVSTESKYITIQDIIMEEGKRIC